MTTDDKRRGDLINRAQSLGMNDAEIQELLELTRADERRACAGLVLQQKSEVIHGDADLTGVVNERLNRVAQAIESRTDAD